MIISKTPLRISFFGGGSDISSYYHEKPGAVLSTTIDKYLYVMVNKKFDPYIRIGYSETEIVHDVNDIRHNIIRECMKHVGGISEGLDIVYMSDVQPYNYGTGLGVSSCIAVGVLNALYAYKGIQVSQQRLAEEACHIEINVLGEPIGKQDQYAVACGGLNKITFNADETVLVEKQNLPGVVMDGLQDSLYLVYTGLTSDSKTVLTEQKTNKNNNTDILTQMVSMVDSNIAALSNLELDKFGNNLHQAWLAKRSLATGISNNQIEQIYDKGLSAGALGGKVLGSGGGGFILFYCPPTKRVEFIKTMAGYRIIKVRFENQGSRIVFNDF